MVKLVDFFQLMSWVIPERQPNDYPFRYLLGADAVAIHGLVPTRRFEVWDDMGKLRTFYTKVEAERFSIGDMFIKEIIPLTPAQHFSNLLAGVGEAPF